ncbi:hypothetical protein PspLS_04016 [Pyricularia sp. CBS 133598]|nr:hypothetical protein PspLS_04016 [Pyricularia sp. CBS 133598]
MGISHSTARWLSPLSFVVDFAAQQYGIYGSSPTMKEVHDANMSFFSPQAYFIGAFFFPQQLFQLAWLWKLHNADPEEEDTKEMVNFAPYYTAGNFAIAAWMIFWCNNDLKTSNYFVIANSLMQLFYVFGRLRPMRLDSTRSILTHVAAKTFAGIGVLDLLHNTGAAYFVGDRPSGVVKALTGVGFAALGANSDWIFGGCLAYDLVALAVGQSQYGDPGWAGMLGAYAVGTAGIVAARNYFRPPYIRSSGYEPVRGTSRST